VFALVVQTNNTTKSHQKTELTQQNPLREALNTASVDCLS